MIERKKRFEQELRAQYNMFKRRGVQGRFFLDSEIDLWFGYERQYDRFGLTLSGREAIVHENDAVLSKILFNYPHCEAGEEKKEICLVEVKKERFQVEEVVQEVVKYELEEYELPHIGVLCEEVQLSEIYNYPEARTLVTLLGDSEKPLLYKREKESILEKWDDKYHDCLVFRGENIRNKPYSYRREVLITLTSKVTEPVKVLGQGCICVDDTLPYRRETSGMFEIRLEPYYKFRVKFKKDKEKKVFMQLYCRNVMASGVVDEPYAIHSYDGQKLKDGVYMLNKSFDLVKKTQSYDTLNEIEYVRNRRMTRACIMRMFMIPERECESVKLIQFEGQDHTVDIGLRYEIWRYFQSKFAEGFVENRNGVVRGEVFLPINDDSSILFFFQLQVLRKILLKLIEQVVDRRILRKGFFIRESYK